MKPKLTLLLEGIPVSCNQFHMGVSNCFLIEADDKKILFNTGPFSERVFLLGKLKSLGIALTDIDVVVLSQLHYDTAVNVDMFTNAEIYVHEKELVFAETTPQQDALMPNYLGRVVRALPKLKTIQGEIYLAEDVKIVELPGVTAGSIGLIAGDTLLAGGAIPTVRSARQKKLEVYQHDPDKALSSIEKALGMAQKIYPGYDRLFAAEDYQVLTEVGMRLRLFFSASGQDQEYSIRSEQQATFASWPPANQLQANPDKN